MKDLIISTKGEILEFKECFKDYDEPKEVYFLGLDKVINEKNKVEKKEEDEEKKYTEKELERLFKIKMYLNIIEIQFI